MCVFQIMRNTLLFIGLVIGAAGFMVGCGSDDRVVEHKESDRGHILDNGRTHTSETTVEHNDGSVTHEESKTKTSY